MDSLSPIDKSKPLCVDLDGSLLLTDMLWETALLRLLNEPFDLLRGPALLMKGRAVMKRWLADGAAFDPALLPYDQRLLDYLRVERDRGRSLVLVTASDHSIATRIAEHLGLFDAVIASDGDRNLKGSVKAEILCARYGAKGFSYAGNGRSDLAVWRQARTAVTVNAPRGVRGKASALAPIEAEFLPLRSQLAALIEAMRPHQWSKNLLIFVPALGAHLLGDLHVLSLALLTFVAFGLASSGSYLINDLLDLENDRKHPRKRNRPFASGRLSLPVGLFGPAYVVLGLAIAAAISWPTALVIGTYIVLTTAYSVALKRQPLIDVFTLAALYSLRIFAGGVATGIAVSNWLLTFSSFLFLSLALVKRCAELRALPPDQLPSRRGYGAEDHLILTVMGVASSFVAGLVLAMYISTDVAQAAYRSPQVLWGLIPLCTFWLCRLWLSTGRGFMHDDPIVYAARDWVSWLVVACSVVILALAIKAPI